MFRKVLKYLAKRGYLYDVLGKEIRSCVRLKVECNCMCIAGKEIGSQNTLKLRDLMCVREGNGEP